jgi:hypothetical protein
MLLVTRRIFPWQGEGLQKIGGTFRADQRQGHEPHEFANIERAGDVKAIKRLVEEKGRAKRRRDSIEHGE